MLARPVTEQGFGPRHPTDAILIDEDGHCHGTLYRGAFDAHLATEAAALTAGHTARVRAVSVHDDEVKRAGLTCGGQADVLLQPLAAIPARWWTLLAEGADAALITRLDASRTRAVSLVAAPDDGTVAQGPVQAMERARELLARRRAGRETHATDAGLVLIETFPAVPHLVIAGGGELAELLVAQAHLLGWQATVTVTAQDTVKLLADRPAAACLIVLSHVMRACRCLRALRDRGARITGASFPHALHAQPNRRRRTPRTSPLSQKEHHEDHPRQRRQQRHRPASPCSDLAHPMVSDRPLRPRMELDDSSPPPKPGGCPLRCWATACSPGSRRRRPLYLSRLMLSTALGAGLRGAGSCLTDCGRRPNR